MPRARGLDGHAALVVSGSRPASFDAAAAKKNILIKCPEIFVAGENFYFDVD